MSSNNDEREADLPSGGDFFKEIYEIWISERPTQLAAALAYFGLFSFAPVIYISFRIAGIFMDQAELLDHFFTRLEAALGPGVAQAIQGMLDEVAGTDSGGRLLISLVSFFFLLLAASGVFFQLQFALNSVWKVPNPAKGAIARTLRQRLFSFLMVIGVGLLLVVAAAFSFIANWLNTLFLMVLGFQPSLTVIAFITLATLAFGVMYKLLPDVSIAWRDVWVGAGTAASLMTLAGGLVIFFVKNTSFASALEAAGSFVILLTGFYYFAQIFLFGAILTRVTSQRRGSMRQLPAEGTPLYGEK
ncbi:MAG: YihY/virulence factor BrkB family protein [Chloroflexota bacterium]|nr:MAG: YihY/virulence factor BrkB family protein [Chloroflexota bacterium]